jgi:hypothetical protein
MPARCPLLGGLVQVVLLSPWLVSTQPVPARSSPLALPQTVIHVFAPPSAPASSKLALAAAGLAGGTKRELPNIAIPALTVDLKVIKFEVADDVDEQLPEVVRQFGGTLALLDTEDLAIARYILEPPSWDAQEGIQDVSRRFRLTMTPASRWKVFRDAARRYGIDLNRYPGCAIFDDTYRRCLLAAIRMRALLDNPDSEGRVSSVRLAFAAGSPCGINVLEVKLAHNAAR